MNLGFVYNVRRVKASLADRRAMREAEFDEPPTIKGIQAALKKLHYKVYSIEADETAFLKLKKLRNEIDLVFNIAEGLRGRDREAQLPAMLEMLGLPYTGSAPLTQAICLNKARAKEILKYYGLATPAFQLFTSGREKLRPGLKFPLIVKPNLEGSSKGIFQDSVVGNKRELEKIVKRTIKEYQQPAIAEELLLGREFTVSLIGNDPAEVLPLVEIDFSVLPKNFLPIDSYETKWIIENPEREETKTAICPAQVSEKLKKKIQRLCLRAKEALEILDWCRLDVRLAKDGSPHILDVNQTPGIIPDPKENSRFPLAARAAGYSYERMIDKIIMAAKKRYKITKK